MKLVMVPLSVLLLASCAQQPAPHAPGPAGVNIANPASVYCQQQGGRLELVERGEGQVGMCHLPDGRVVEEWKLYRQDHPA